LPKKVAIIEDEAELASLLEYNLQRQGLLTRIISGSKGALEQLESWKPDLVILDVMLPDGDGFDLCRRMRKLTSIGRTPVVFLTARSDEVDRVLGLEIGGDDYVTKPFSPRELMARVKAHLRRGEEEHSQETSPDLLHLGPFTLDRAAHRLSLRDQELTLTSTEFRLLEFFLTHPGRAYSREQLLEEVWGQQHFVSPRTVDVHVRRLRERIEEQADDPQYLATVRGFGYRFEAPQ
jgi:Response regulators consisting of a CheY-like receiver domain and a winged-helix DNA-binding domain